MQWFAGAAARVTKKHSCVPPPPGAGSPSQGVRISPMSDSVLRYVWLSAIIHRQAKSSFSWEWTGGLPRLLPSEREHGFSRTSRISALLKWAVSATTARS